MGTTLTILCSGPMRRLMQTIEQNGALREVWYGGSGNEDDKCVGLTVEFLGDSMAHHITTVRVRHHRNH